MPACYDAEAQVLWNALAPELWRRTTIAIQRALGRLVGLQEARAAPAGPDLLRQGGRVPTTRGDPLPRRHPPGRGHRLPLPRLPGPTTGAVHRRPPRGRPAAGGPGRPACPARRWTTGRAGMPAGASSSTSATSPSDSDQAGELCAEQVAGYIAKYATKATESFGAGLDRRIDADDLDHLDGLPAHVAELVRACWELGGRPELAGPAAAAVGAHARVRRPLVDQEPPLLHHHGRPASGPGRLRQAPPGQATACPWMPGAGPRTTRP